MESANVFDLYILSSNKNSNLRIDLFNNFLQFACSVRFLNYLKVSIYKSKINILSVTTLTTDWNDQTTYQTYAREHIATSYCFHTF